MSILQQGDVVYKVTVNWGVEEVSFQFEENTLGAIWVTRKDQEKVDPSELNLFCLQPHQWRPTHTEALRLLREKLLEQRSRLWAEIVSIDQALSEVEAQLYPFG